MLLAKSVVATTDWPKFSSGSGNIHIHEKGMQTSMTRISAGKMRRARLS